ncbi:hypothetical protein HanRHA438_Chr14g0673271 [Helianthus annuus]|nr:hypothetical protein HanRHA438_Chr14g0673271 [Helianthus annuus]
MMMRQKPRVSDPLMSGGNRELGSQEESNFDSFCFAEARKKKFLELYPKPCLSPCLSPFLPAPDHATRPSNQYPPPPVSNGLQSPPTTSAAQSSNKC